MYIDSSCSYAVLFTLVVLILVSSDQLVILISIIVITTDQYDKEYQSCLQKLPKELSVTLDAHDHPPVTKAVNCRRLFGVLHVLNNIV